MSRADFLQSECDKLRSLVYLTDKSVEDIEMNTTSLRQINEYIRWMKARGDKPEHCSIDDPNYDPTLYCTDCMARYKRFCDCPPRAEND